MLSASMQKFADMPKALGERLEEKNIFIATYTNKATGRSYERLLVKNEDGKYFDYRMFSDAGNKKNWLTQEEWWKRVGLGGGYACEIKSFDGVKLKLEEQKIKAKPVAVQKQVVTQKTAPAQKPADVGWQSLSAPSGKYFKNVHRVELEKSLAEGKLDGPVMLSLYYEQRDMDKSKKQDRSKPFTNVRGEAAQRVTGFRGILERAEEVLPLVEKYAKMYNVPLEEALALFATETMLIANGKSTTGCAGIGQLSTATAMSLTDRDGPEGKPIFTQRRKSTSKKTGAPITVLDDIYDVEKNIQGSIRYFSQMLGKFGDFQLAMVAYNKGEGYARKFVSGGQLDEAGKGYARRGSDFKRFFGDINVRELGSMGVDRFMQSEKYIEGYMRIAAHEKKEGYL